MKGFAKIRDQRDQFADSRVMSEISARDLLLAKMDAARRRFYWAVAALVATPCLTLILALSILPAHEVMTRLSVPTEPLALLLLLGFASPAIFLPMMLRRAVEYWQVRKMLRDNDAAITAVRHGQLG